MLFLSIIFLCFSVTFAEDIFKLLKISKLFIYLLTPKQEGLHEDLRKAREELEIVKNSGPGRGEFSVLIKTERAKQKVKDLEEKILRKRIMGQFKSTSVGLIVNYGVKTVLYIILAVISIRNRYNPVLVFSEQFNFEPLQGLLTFPTGVPNAVSVPVWVISCNVTFRLISGLMKLK